MTFSGEKLRQIRLARGRSQRDLPVAHDTISRIESGRRQPHPSTLRKLAEALGVEVHEFFEGAEEDPKAAAPESPQEWLRAHNAKLLALSEEELSNIFEALYSGDSVKFADRINKEFETVGTARAVADNPSDPVILAAYAHAVDRYFQARKLAPFSTSFDPDNPEKPETVTLYSEKVRQSDEAIKGGQREEKTP
jgi:transcriptional regulator with XRE-family HTH domain